MTQKCHRLAPIVGVGAAVARYQGSIQGRRRSPPRTPDRLAASAHRRRVAANLARAVASLHSAARPTPKEIRSCYGRRSGSGGGTLCRSGESGRPDKLWSVGGAEGAEPRVAYRVV